MPRPILAALAAVCLLLTACDDDPARPKNTESTPPYKDGTERWHVLHNIGAAYNRMDADQYDTILDDHFVFYFHFLDVGGDIPTSWNRRDEMAATDEMLRRGGGRHDNPIVSQRLTLSGVEVAAWSETTPRPGFSGETWYTAWVGYHYVIDTDDYDGYATDGSAMITVREQTDGTWKMVEMRDLASGALTAASPGGLESSWGRVKALYYMPPDRFEDLSKEWHVLHNLEHAYDDRNAGRVQELLDADNFIFYFSPDDVGGSVPGQWDYAAEMQAATNMFTGGGGVDNNPIVTIDLTLFDDQVTWADVTGHPDFPGETLRQATVNYDYYIDTAQDRQFITSGTPSAQFVVRNIDGTWKIVRWYDLSNGPLLRASVSTEESNWGKVKALYQ